MLASQACHCPEIQDADWHMQDQNWNGKFFYYEDVPHLFNVPLGYEKRLATLKTDLNRKGYQLLNPDMILYQPGLFQGRILMEIADPQQYDANVEQFENARMLSRVYAGPRAGTGNALGELKAFTLDRTHIEPVTIFYWHVTCSKCARTRGGEKTVLFARV